ncbi:MAG: cupin domain-containing protein [Anaerolineae bacterium]|nr:cupin domain-containing protein [Anaerolineae bacterium]MDW8069699.1 cupin domain-containing protein [Anaerolineae bacterium]
MTFFTVSALPATEMMPGVRRRAVYLEQAMVTFFEFAPGSVLPEHAHPHEQITFVVQGAMEFTLGNETRVLKAGDGVCVPSGVPHKAVVLDEPTFVLDAWAPQREDYR